MEGDLYNNIKIAHTLKPSATGYNAATSGSGVDTAGYESCTFEVNLGVFTGTTPVATFKLQESDDNSAFTDIAAGDLLGGLLSGNFGTAEDDQIYKRGYIGSKRYVRFRLDTVTGTTPVIAISAAVILGDARRAPVA